MDVEMTDANEPVDKEQLEEYKEMIVELGGFPDKVMINSLSMIAEDFAESHDDANAIYKCIREPLVSPQVSNDRKLPLVYVIDSILKNVKGNFIEIVESDAKIWLQIVYNVLPDDKRAKLKKVWNLWKDSGIFNEASWKDMGSCFVGGGGGTTASNSSSTSTTNNNNSSALGDSEDIPREKDGSLKLAPALRNEMQKILDDLQSDLENELEKVSLERLAIINVDLLRNIKNTAQDNLNNGSSQQQQQQLQQTTVVDLTQSNQQQSNNNDGKPSFVVETRTPAAVEQSKAWNKLKLNYLNETHDLISKLQHMVREGSSSESRYTRSEAIAMTGALAAAASTARLLTLSIQELKDEAETRDKNKLSLSGSKNSNQRGTAGAGGAIARGFLTVDKSLFTNDGIKKKNGAVIGVLYDVGLPFVSSADGRRFATQMELSNHLDALFKKGQLEKTMARTEERGWYVMDTIWTGEIKKNETGTSNAGGASNQAGSGVGGDPTMSAANDNDNNDLLEADPSTFTVPADESRDRCVICGINFKMFFDNDDGIYKYNNCREIEVMNDDVAEEESSQMLVHVTCWRGLGAPSVLTMDQALQDALH